jgi:hypothetical protein
MKKRWIRDYCPFAADQGFLSVIGDVAPGELVFGFSWTGGGLADVITFETVTPSYAKVKQMKNDKYRVQVTKTSAGSVVTTPVYVYGKTKIKFNVDTEAGEVYDIIVIGKVAY